MARSTARGSLTALILATLVFGLASCSDQEIQNSPPYSCEVIPRHAFVLTTDPEDQNDPLEVDVKEGNFNSGYYSCVAEKGGSRFIYHQWQGDQAADGRKIMLSGRKFDAKDVPAEMGEGWVGSPLGTGWVHWRCDDQAVLSEISYPAVRERDEAEDILRLLEIAQQRYAELNDCEIRPPK